jgi:ribonuclease HI
MRYLTGTSWGADRTVMLRVYRALVRSKLDYGSIVFDSARSSYIKPLNTIHHTGIRLALGALRTSRVESLYCDSGEPPLALRRQYLLTSYASKIMCMKDHPTYQSLLNPRFEPLYNAKPFATLPAGIRLARIFIEQTFRIPRRYPVKFSSTPPWFTQKPACLTGLAELGKANTSSIVFKRMFAEIQEEYADHIFYYTDGSKNDIAVGSAFVSGSDVKYSFKLDARNSVFTAELFAIEKALQHIEDLAGISFCICSDSLSSIQALDNIYSANPLVQGIHSLLASLSTKGVRVVFCWVPGHVGIQGNELADEAAKESLVKVSLDDKRVAHYDLKILFKSIFKLQFQAIWDAQLNNKLKEIKNTIEPWESSIRSVRREEVVLTRLRIGHTILTHSFLFANDPEPLCETCLTPLTVKHILVECRKFIRERRQVAMKDKVELILGDDSKMIDKLFKFLTITHLINKL